MQPKDVLKQMIQFNKSTFDNAFKNLGLLQQQMEQTMNLYIDQAGGLSDEGKKAAKDWTAMYKKGFDDYKKLIDENFSKLDAFFEGK